MEKFYFVQDWGTFTDLRTLVFVGYSVQEISKILKKRFHASWYEAWQKDHGKPDSRDNLTGLTGTFWHREGFSIIYFPSFQNVWQDWETLMHETFHAVINMLGRKKCLINYDTELSEPIEIEQESMAYQQEYLFHSIRKKLLGKMRKKKSSRRRR